jgi:hypothetical protein
MARNNINDISIDIPQTRISFDVGAFDDFIRSQGIKLVHYMAVPCPVGMVDLDDNRRPHPDHENCSNGFVYVKCGTVTALFSGNNNAKKPDDLGFWDGSSASVTLPRYYDDDKGNCTELIFVAPFDRFYTETPLLVPTWQRYLHTNTTKDRLKYPVEKVVYLKDSRGEVYYENDDFTLEQGQIAWGSRRPAPQLDVGPYVPDRGEVCSIRYLYRPYWYVGTLMHELRVSQVTNNKGVRGVERMPQQVLLHREYMALNQEQQEPGSPGASKLDADALRTVLGPMSGGFGPR